MKTTNNLLKNLSIAIVFVFVLGTSCKTEDINLSNINYVSIPAGTFIMGSRGSQVTVKLSAFLMSKHEITNAQFATFLNAKGIGSDGLYPGGKFPTQMLIYSSKEFSPHGWDWGLHFTNNKWVPAAGYENYPVTYVTWYGATEFASYVGGTLPTEAQWEYACRADLTNKTRTNTTTSTQVTNITTRDTTYTTNTAVSIIRVDTAFTTWTVTNVTSHSNVTTTIITTTKDTTVTTNKPFDTGDNLTNLQANYNWSAPWINGTNTVSTPSGKTQAVGSYPANAYGLFDMHGNVSEWCSDWYGPYKALPLTNPVGAVTGTYRVARGGSWFSSASGCTSDYRLYYYPSYLNFDVGFRVVFVP